MGESKHPSEERITLAKALLITENRLKSIEIILQRTEFMGDSKNECYINEKRNLIIFILEIRSILQIINTNRGKINRTFEIFVVEFLNTSSFMLEKLKKIIQLSTPATLLGGENMRITAEDFREVQEIRNAVFEKLSDLNYKLQEVLDTVHILDSYKLEYTNSFKTDLINISKENTQENEENEEKLNQIKNGLDNYKKNILEIDKQIKTNAESTKSNFNEILKLNTEIQELNNTISKEIKNIIANSENITKDEMDSLNNSVEKYKNNIIKKMDNDLLICINHHEEMDEKIKSTLDATRDAHKDFISLVERAGIYELTQNYKIKAEEEKKEYKNYRLTTVLTIISAIIITLGIILIPIVEYWGINPPVKIDYWSLFSRLTISLIFFVLAFYTSKQAGKHYECYQENHRTYLQLAALEPFISRMSDDDKLAIRKELISVYFNKTDDGKFAAKGDEVDLPSNWSSIVHKLIDTVKDNKQAAKNEE